MWASSKRSFWLRLHTYWWRCRASLRRKRSSHRSRDSRGHRAVHDILQRRSGVLRRRWRSLGAAEVRCMRDGRATGRGWWATQAWRPTMRLSCRSARRSCGNGSAGGARWRDPRRCLQRRKRGGSGWGCVPCLRRRRRCARRRRGRGCREVRGSSEGRDARQRRPSQPFDFGLELCAFELLFTVLLLLTANFGLERGLALLEF